MNVDRELKEFRREIDRIDDQIASLLDQRVRVVAAIRDVKRRHDDSMLALRPGREADILRRIAANPDNAFPRIVMLKIWREIICVMTRLQSRLVPAIVDGPLRHVVERLAIDHFGTQTVPLVTASAEQAIQAVRDGHADLVLLPVPGVDDRWWLELCRDQDWQDDPRQALNIVGRLPFIGGTESRLGSHYWMVASIPLDRSRSDRSVFALEVDLNVSRGALVDVLRAARLSPIWLGAVEDREICRTIHLIDVKGFKDEVERDLSPRLIEIFNSAHRMMMFGSYPEPLYLPEA